MGHICHEAISVKTFWRDDVVFCTGEIPDPPTMYFVASGKLEYDHPVEALNDVLPGTWVSEAALWVVWFHQGILRTRMESCLLTLNATHFHSCICKFQEVTCQPWRYAIKFSECILRAHDKESMSDLTSSAMAEDIVKQAYADEMLLSMRRYSPFGVRISKISKRR